MRYPKAGISRTGEKAGHLGAILEYRPHLDGLRGVSILTVTAVHALLPDIRAISSGAAFVGVNTFFVLSGFLITGLLIEEWKRFGSLNLRLFYARRALRLLPALAVLLGSFIAGAYLFSSREVALGVARDALFPACYVANWTRAMGLNYPVLFAHTWSLSIEEQFYLIWPPVLVLFLRTSKSRASLLYWFMLAIFLVVVVRVLLVAGGAPPERIFNGTDMRADSLLLGGLLAAVPALGLHRLDSVGVIVRVSGWGAAPLLVWFSFRRDFNQPFAESVLYPVASICAALIILEVEVSPAGLLSKFFGQPCLAYVGKLSYGLYLWHAPIFQIVFGRGWPRAQELLVAFSLTAIATLSSYYLLEMPLLQLKRRLSPVMLRPATPIPPGRCPGLA